MRIILGFALLLSLTLPAAVQAGGTVVTIGGEDYALDAGPGFCAAAQGDLERWSTWERLMSDTHRRFETKAVFLDCLSLRAIREGAQPDNFALRVVGTALGGGEPLPATNATRMQFDLFRGVFRMMEQRPDAVKGVPVKEIVHDIAEERGLVVGCARPRTGRASAGLDLCFSEPDGSGAMRGGVSVRPIGGRFVAGAALNRPGEGEGPGFEAAESLLDGLAPTE